MMQRRWSLWRTREQRDTRPRSADEQERRARRGLWLVTAAFGLALWAILAVRPPAVAGLRPGYPSPIPIKADRGATFVSQIKTDEERARRESAADTVVYTSDTVIPTEQRQRLTDVLQTISQIREDPSLTDDEQRTKLAELPNSTIVISPELASQIASLPDMQWSGVRQQAIELYDRALREHNFQLSDEDVATLRERSMPYWATLLGQPEEQALALVFASSFLKANYVLDEEATARRKQEARASVEPISVQVLEGESVVREGDRITPEVEEKLEALGLLQTRTDWYGIGGRGILAGLTAALFGVFLRVARKPIWTHRRRLLVFYGLAAVTLLVARLVIVLPLGPNWPYAFPLGAAVLLLTALFGSVTALLSATLLSVVIALIGNSDFGLGATLVLGTMSGAFVLGRANRSLRFVLAGLAIMVASALVQTALWLTTVGEPAPEQLLPILSTSGMNGALSAILALGLYNLVGQLADIVTPFQLMELAHPAQPLLRKLMREAPGTYYHSVGVGNLAESAAEAIGADALLLRVAAYYHDVGKAARPFFYTDNQSDRENVHNDLDPLTSAEIIAGHVREGVNMARAAGLPRQIVDFIPAHHGTSVIQHFYQIALQQEDAVDVANYRYPGPKPQTKEQAILMLADSVEATVRSKAQHGKLISVRQKTNGQNGAQTLEEMVTSIVDERLRSGQLDESPLTLTDLSKIRQAFITTLAGMYHPRTEYAQQIIKAS